MRITSDNPLTAARVAWGFVAFESSIYVTPSLSATTCKRWASGRNPLIARAYRVGFDPVFESRSGCGYHILDSRCPHQRDVVNGHDIRIPPPHATVDDTDTPFRQGVSREGHHAGLGGGSDPHGEGIFCVGQKDIVRSLVLDDAPFRRRVSRRRSMPVSVVLGDVQDDGHAWGEALYRRELEARHLQSDRAALGYREDRLDQRQTDVAGRYRGDTAFLQHGGQQTDRRGLSVRASNREEVATRESEGELHLAYGVNALSFERLHDRRSRWDPRTYDRQVSTQHLGVVSPGLDLSALAPQGIGPHPYVLMVGRLGNADLCVERQQSSSCREPTNAQAHNKDALAGELTHNVPPLDRKSA